MKVKCDGYTYVADFPLDIGDRVIVEVSPEWRSVFGTFCERTVTALQSDYAGHCQRVIGFAPPKRDSLSK